MSSVEDGAEGEQNRSIVSTRFVDGIASTPTRILRFLDGIRKPDGAVDQDHPRIRDLMRQAKRDKLDVVVIPRGNGIDGVAGRFLANDHHRLIKIGIGVAIGLTAAGAAAGFILRKHKR